VSEVSLASEVGGDVVFATPWDNGATPKVADGSGNAVPVSAVSPGVFSFATSGGASYVINAATA
jgi:hypothetical protein